MKMAAKRRATLSIDTEHQDLVPKKVKKPNNKLVNVDITANASNEAKKEQSGQPAKTKNEKRKESLQRKTESQHREWEVQWLRPEVELDTSSDPVHFQQIDVQRYQNILVMFGSTPDGQSVACFIKNIPSLEQINAKFRGSNWITLQPGMYELKTGEKRTRCQLEIDTGFDNVVVDNHPGQGMAPFRILGIEVEVAKNGEGYPDSKRDTVVSIANMVMINGENLPFVRVLFTTSAVNNIDGTQVWICKDEKELLQKWMDFVAKIDPDIITGYSVYLCDFPFLLNRMKILNTPIWKSLGRINQKLRMLYSALVPDGKANVEEAYDLKGVVLFDVYNYVRAHYEGLASHKLEDACSLVGHRIPFFSIGKIKAYKIKTNGSMQMALFTLQKTLVPLLMMSQFRCLNGYIQVAQKGNLRSTLQKVLQNEMVENENRRFNYYSGDSEDSDQYGGSDYDYFGERNYKFGRFRNYY